MTAKGKAAVDDRKRKADKSAKLKAKREKKAMKDPNKPKRAPSAFFVFLEEFRKTFKQENPHVTSVAAVGKAGGDKWKSMSPAEKAPYEAKAAKKKEEYEVLIKAYNRKQAGIVDNEESDKSKSEVHDENDGEEGEEDEDDDEDDE